MATGTCNAENSVAQRVINAVAASSLLRVVYRAISSCAAPFHNPNAGFLQKGANRKVESLKRPTRLDERIFSLGVLSQVYAEMFYGRRVKQSIMRSSRQLV